MGDALFNEGIPDSQSGCRERAWWSDQSKRQAEANISRLNGEEHSGLTRAQEETSWMVVRAFVPRVIQGCWECYVMFDVVL